MDLLTTLGVLTDELHTVADTIDGEVTCLSQGLEDVDLLVADSEHSWTVDFTDDGDLVVGHADGDNRILLGIHVALDLVVDEFLTHGLREATNLQCADDGEVDATVVIDEVGLKGTTTVTDIATSRIQRVAHHEVKGLGGCGIDRTDGDSQNVLRHDAGIVEVLRLLIVDVVAVLDVSDVLGGAAGGQEYCDCSENGIE